MYRKELNEQSPLRILEASMHGGLGQGNLGVVLARAGVGKTACLVQIGLDDLMRGRRVLHLALGGQTVEHVQSWYDSLFDDLANMNQLVDREAVRASLAKNRLIRSHGTARLSAQDFDQVLTLFSKHLQFDPQAILVDGFDWTGPVATTAASLGAMRAAAQRLNAELWVTAQTRLAEAGPHPAKVPPPCAAYLELIDVAVSLEPEDDHVVIRLLKDHDEAEAKTTSLKLQCDTMRLVAEEGGRHSGVRLPASACTLLSGAARGTESEFGACAERWGLREVNYSFEGRPVGRSRGVVLLTDGELRRGNVSDTYLKAHMHRTYPDTPLFKKVLQSIWHQVNTASQVFVVGMILEDGTIKGGTGWAAELAKRLNKPVYVFDQERRGWHVWKDGQWVEEAEPVITSRRFTGTGTRDLAEHGREAIHGLFARSFGAA